MMLAEGARRWAWLLLLALAVLGPPLTGDPYVAHLMVLGSLSALLAVGLNVALGFAGLFSFAQGAFYGIGAYVSALLVLSWGARFWTAFLAAGVAAGLAGFLLGLLTIRLGGHYLAIATFAFQEIVIVVIRNWDSVTKGPLGLSGVPGPGPLTLPGLPPIEFHSELAYYYLALAVLVSVLVGGLGTIMGPVLGGIALTFLPEYLRAFQEHRFTIYGALLIVVIIALPGGVAGALQTLARRWRARAQAARP